MQFKQPEYPVIGQPNGGGDAVSGEIQQGHPDTCAIRSQEIILRDFGIEVDEETLIREATEHGWYEGSGTSYEDVGKLLELHVVSVTQYTDAGINDILDELEAGHKVIVSVDSGELWDPACEWGEDFFLGDRADHALIVSGIDASDPDNIKVIVTDPGTGNVAKAYPLEQFMDAWDDSRNFMVETDESAPELDSASTGLGAADVAVTSSAELPYGQLGVTVPGYGYYPGDVMPLDLDGNGITDCLAIDLNHNGVADAYLFDVNQAAVARLMRSTAEMVCNVFAPGGHVRTGFLSEIEALPENEIALRARLHTDRFCEKSRQVWAIVRS